METLTFPEFAIKTESNVSSTATVLNFRVHVGVKVISY